MTHTIIFICLQVGEAFIMFNAKYFIYKYWYRIFVGILVELLSIPRQYNKQQKKGPPTAVPLKYIKVSSSIILQNHIIG